MREISLGRPGERRLRAGPELPEAASMIGILTYSEHHLLDWLGLETDAIYGECKGRDFDVLHSLRLVEFVTDDPRGLDYCRVALTQAGKEDLRMIGPWHPKATI
jgi:hypothetical protein